MTPAEQSLLPWTLDEGGLRPSKINALRRMIIPVLRHAPSESIAGRSIVGVDRNTGGTQISYRTRFDHQGVDVDAWVTALMHPDLVDVPHGETLATQNGDDTIRRVAGSLAHILETLLEAPRGFRDEHPVTWDRATHAAERMIERMTARGCPGCGLGDACTGWIGHAVDVMASNPLGMGGVIVQANDGHGIDEAHIIDTSPDLCVPGPVTISMVDGTSPTGTKRTIRINVHPRVHSQGYEPLEPMRRLRLEHEHPLDPSRIGRMPTPPKAGS